MNVDIIDQLLGMPNAEQIVDQVKIKLEKEKAERSKFYNWVTPSVKAEFINGEIIIHSPVKLRHNNASGRIYKIISDFVEDKGLGFCGHEKIMISLTRNDYEPDVVFFDTKKCKEFKEDMSRFPAPDFIAEVLSKSTASHDRGIKFKDYALHKVREYWIVDAKKQIIEQYELEGDKYVLKNKLQKDKTITSFVIRDLEFPVLAIFDAKAYKIARKQLDI